MMTKTIAGVLAVSLLAGAASCGKRKKKSRWNPPAAEQTQPERTDFPVCWSDLSNLPCVVPGDAGKGVLHLPAVETGVVNTRDVLLVLRLENGDWRVQPA